MSDRGKNTLDVGMVLDGKWVILDFIGKGGMGEVYRAHQLNLKRDVAIKIISRDWVESFDCDAQELENSMERFRREVRVMAQARHPNVLQIFDYGALTIQRGEEEIPVEFLAMEYVPGSSLRDTMSDEGFYPEEDRMKEWLDKYFIPLLDGVQALHELGIVHRDLKPENVLLAGDIPKIADFGLARSCVLKPITKSMHVLGTPPYMAQEQFMDLRRSDQRADVYALGKILYESASGRMRPDRIPFRQARLDNPEGIFYQSLDRIIRDATVEERNERFASVADLKKAIEDVQTGTGKASALLSRESVKIPLRNKLRQGKGLWFAAVVILILVAIITYGLVHEQRGHQQPAPVSRPTTSEAPSGTHSEKSGVPGVARVTAPPVNLQRELRGKDEATLNLVPGGEITYPKNFGMESGEPTKVTSFYMDKTPVTNHQYVEFLNAAVSRITVENGVVRADGNIWLLLGEATPGYEPVIFKDGKFHVKAAHHAACPVLRVTAYGATAYLDFYGRRLPTVAEWCYALTAGAGGSEGDVSDFQTETSLPIPTPVMVYKPNRFGVRGLNANIGEWGGKELERPEGSTGGRPEYVVLGGISKFEQKEMVPAPVGRYPWEAFERVGFRGVRDIDS